MAKYTSDARLIKGAATAYKNWDNVPGMYAGLDKTIQGGKEMAEEAITDLEKDKKEDDLIRKKFNTISAGVYEKAGGLGKDDFTHAVGYMKELEQRHYDALKNEDAEGAASVNMDFKSYLEGVENQKNLRKDIAGDGTKGTGMSNAVKGDDLKFITAWQEGKYKKSNNPETNEWQYTVNVDGIGEVTKTDKEIKKMAQLKNNLPFAAYKDKLEKYIKNGKKGNTELLAYDIRENVIPQDPNDLNAFLNDEGFAMTSGNFESVMKQPNNKQSFIDEINMALYDTDGDVTNDYDEFLDAITNPNNKFWETQGEGAWKKAATDIAAEVLTTATENTWAQMWGGEEDGSSGESGALN